MSEIIDSGERRQFSTGAVRDCSSGKGRCDLLPLDAIVPMFGEETIIRAFAYFENTGDTKFLYEALNTISKYYADDYGAAGDEGRYEMLLCLAKHFEKGLEKYGEFGERNWEKGIPCHSFVDSAIRHYLKFRHGYDDEDHLIAFIWNTVCLLWTLDHKPEMNDLPYTKRQTKDIDLDNAVKECEIV